MLFDKGSMRHNRKKVQSRLHRVGTFDVFKISQSYFYGDRYLFDNGVNSLAYFYRDILNQQ